MPDSPQPISDSTLPRPGQVPAEAGHGLLDMPLTAHMMVIRDLRAGTICGFEFLVRGMIGGRLEFPGALMDRAKAENLLVPFDLRCFEATVAMAESVPEHFFAFVNIYAQTLLVPEHLALVLERLKSLVSRGRVICLEIHESMTVTEARLLAEAFQAIKKAGVRLALDDLMPKNLTFGHLRIRPDFIKVDREILTAMTPVEAARTINMLARCQQSLGFELIVEGIEDQRMLSIATFAGARYGQGFLWGKPGPREEHIAPVQVRLDETDTTAIP
jgi:EAL domain-containing protein (putative c-di-GMP-specific phosphodiesterase class I)